MNQAIRHKKKDKLYSVDFFNQYKDGSLRSAEIIVPIIIDLLHPTSVVDVGCGVGTWLSVFRAHGVLDILGVDGEYIDRSLLQIPSDRFLPMNLEKPIFLKRSFDVALSLEVAEHLSEKVSIQFIRGLTMLAPAVLFSAAIPFQMGTNHINEQWQSYWAEIFDSFGYVPSTSIRDKIWNNSDVEVWYRQNIVLYIKKDCLDSRTYSITWDQISSIDNLSVVHPELFLAAADPKTLSISRFFSYAQGLPSLFLKIIRRLFLR